MLLLLPFHNIALAKVVHSRRPLIFQPAQPIISCLSPQDRSSPDFSSNPFLGLTTVSHYFAEMATGISLRDYHTHPILPQARSRT